MVPVRKYSNVVAVYMPCEPLSIDAPNYIAVQLPHQTTLVEEQEYLALQARLAACEQERDGFRELARSQMESCARHCAEQAQAEARVQALEASCKEHLELLEKSVQQKVECMYCENHEKLEQENARLREALNAVLFDVRENGGILPTTSYRYAKELKGE